jgi:hypothetical protein
MAEAGCAQALVRDVPFMRSDGGERYRSVAALLVLAGLRGGPQLGVLGADRQIEPGRE